MRLTLNVKGDLEEFIKEEMQNSGLSGGMVGYWLMVTGKEYKESLRAMNMLSQLTLQKGDIKNEYEKSKEGICEE